jgi:hypothetical protein
MLLLNVVINIRDILLTMKCKADEMRRRRRLHHQPSFFNLTPTRRRSISSSKTKQKYQIFTKYFMHAMTHLMTLTFDMLFVAMSRVESGRWAASERELGKQRGRDECEWRMAHTRHLARLRLVF